MMDNEKLNELVTSYQSDRNEETFEQLYAMVSANWKSLDTVGKSVKASEAEILAAYEDTLLKCLEVYDGRGDFINLLNRSIWRKRRRIYTKKKTLNRFEVYDKYDGSSNVYNSGDTTDYLSFESMVNANNTEDTTAATVISKKKADQRQLIDSLLNGADETTTAIVATFLAHPKPTATAIAKELGVHHSKVTRALNRLAGKFSTKQFGDYHDYLVAL